MRKLINLLFVCLLTTTVAFACPPSQDGEKKASTDAVQIDAKFASLDLDVVGMTCAGCENKVKALLSGMDGVVATTKVCSQSDKAILTFDPSVVSSEDIVKTLGEKTGYSITVSKNAGVSEGAVKKSCSESCAKACCSNKASGKKSCTKAQAKSCAKTKAAGNNKLEKE